MKKGTIFRFFTITSLIFCVLIWHSCSDEAAMTESESFIEVLFMTPADKETFVAMGLNLENFAIINEGYLYEGDVLFRFENMDYYRRVLQENPKTSNSSGKFQYYEQFMVWQTPIVKLKIDTESSAGNAADLDRLAMLLDRAIDSINSVPGFRLEYSRVSGTGVNYNTLVQIVEELPSDPMPIGQTFEEAAVGIGDWGQNGYPGAKITLGLNNFRNNGLAADESKFPLFVTALIHEIGHNIGIIHSNEPSPPNAEQYQIGVLEGSPEGGEANSTFSAVGSYDTNKLTLWDKKLLSYMYPYPDGEIDAAIRESSTSKFVYFFRKNMVMKFNMENMYPERGYPKLISQEFPHLPIKEDIDAAHIYYEGDRKTGFFFKDAKYYKYDMANDIINYGPKNILTDWSTWSQLKAATLLDSDNAYHFETCSWGACQTCYMRYKVADDEVASHFSLCLSEFDMYYGIPLEAAVTYGDYTYFFYTMDHTHVRKYSHETEKVVYHTYPPNKMFIGLTWPESM